MINNNDIIKEEINKLLLEIIEAYENSGKKVTGEFADDLKAEFEENKATIWGNATLAGRKAGKMPPISNLKEWVINKGIFKIKNDNQATGIAWAIAKTIAKKGTNEQYHLKIYDKIITPKRIDEIIKKVEQFNLKYFLDEIDVKMTKLTKNI